MRKELKKKRLLELAAHLRRTPRDRFDMEHFCGSACCIAGHVYAKEIGIGRWGYLTGAEVFNKAKAYLGLTEGQACQLFTPDTGSTFGGRSPYLASPRKAAAVVKHLAETGKVDWNVKVR